MFTNSSDGGIVRAAVEPEPSEPGQRMACPACNSRYEAGVAFCPKDGTKLEGDGVARSGQPSLVGKVIADRYRVIRKLGEGGMGEVFEAQHVYIDKPFAIKLLRPEITSNPEAVARFHQEARSAASIGHDNIVAVEDFGRLADGSVYLAMELLRGQSLSDRLRKPPPLTYDEYLGYTLQVSQGLAAAHQKGIVHRDMKPENIFLTEKHGHTLCKILDFGIAKVNGEGGSQSLTRTGAIFGTPHYMSPEQALGKSLDHRSDIYSLGVIMYEMSTGRVPYTAESFMGILTQHITGNLIRPSVAAPDRNIPPEFEAVILRAMAKEPADRYATMDELGEVLIGLGASSLLPAPRPSGEGRPPSGSIPLRSPTGPVSPSRSTGPAPAIGAPSQSMASATHIAMAESGISPHRSSVVVVAGVAIGSLLFGAGLVALLVLHPFSRPNAPSRNGAPAAHKPVSPVPAVTVEMLLDSIPTGAMIEGLPDPKADTPEVVNVAPGTTRTVTLHKEGYVDQRVTIDPSHSDRKQIVRLERVEAPKVETPKSAVDESRHHPVRPPSLPRLHVDEEPREGTSSSSPPVVHIPPPYRAPPPLRPVGPAPRPPPNSPSRPQKEQPVLLNPY